jgi:hypothetical protein
MEDYQILTKGRERGNGDMAKADWLSIRSEYESMDISQRKLAEKYDVSYPTLRDRAKREEWISSKVKTRDKIVKKTLQKVATKIADRNAKLLNISDMATNAIQEYFKEKHYKQHVVKYKHYDREGKPDKEELTSVKLAVADTKGMANMIGSLSKIQTTQRLAEGINTANEGLGNDLPDDGFMEALENKAKDIWSEGDPVD